VAGTKNLAEAFEQICLMDGPLNVRLAAYAQKLKELNFPFAEAYDNLVGRLMAGEIGSTAPNVGDVMPHFVLPTHHGELVGLVELLEKGPVIVSFNRGHWCSFCKIELRTIAAHASEIAACGAHVVSILPDRQQYVGKLRADTRGAISILTDIDNGYALSLGLVMWLGEKLCEIMHGSGLDLSVIQGNEGWYVPLPATFVVGF
jgi:peroxiredoxin